ncbi:MAG: PLP-dependent aspartate aminotransferase family protein [Sediminibacterium sp.]|jgi:cystathionine beta-lyase/cystathionine gamma-synthase|uniref:trans-sulfuration enzyme family protein n=1 Tax=Sediminibacterium sp. TaxID=1917865 RepID=UPI002ABCBB45|nr:PLP-dependent aspartate aminotransferase family protein [Sediminibacterium sp.]MDZ4072009.1 PLP-dependent aspartate aminotransferase family protein [Sediminibacterium sp.]
MDISYILNELGEDRDEYFRAVSPPIVQTSNFAFKTVDDLRKAFENEYGGWLYSRGLNPTVEILRKKLAALDGAEDCLVFNSGAAAIFASVLANVKAGDHIVSVKDPYTWARKMFDEILPRFGVTVTYIDGRSITNFENAIQSNTTVIYLESPNSWMFDLQDLSAVAQLARSKNMITICDNSFCTPLYQKPYEMGIDLVLQSATKYISGHSDVIAGVLSGSKQQIERIFNSEYNNIGSGIQPFNAWLLIRGLRTLPARLERITRTTQIVIEFLLSHPRVEEVIFPLHPSFPQYELAQRQMSGGCGLLTFTIKTQSCETIEKFCNSLKHILMAVSWGGHESLIIPKCAGLQRADFNAELDIHRSCRLYVGLEEPEYIIADLQQAFDVIKVLS